jgi:hypothetical protein
MRVNLLRASVNVFSIEKGVFAGHQWLQPVILATWEAEIRKI